jgi:hypothetical protein
MVLPRTPDNGEIQDYVRRQETNDKSPRIKTRTLRQEKSEKSFYAEKSISQKGFSTVSADIYFLRIVILQRVTILI